MKQTPTTGHSVHRRVRAWWADAVLTGSPHQRVRVAFLGSLSVFGVIVVVALWSNLSVLRTLTLHGEIIEVIGQLQLHTERIERLVGTAPENAIDEAVFTEELDRFERDIEHLDRLTQAADYRRMRRSGRIDSVIAHSTPPLRKFRESVARLQASGAPVPAALIRDVQQNAAEYQASAGASVRGVHVMQNADVRDAERTAWSRAALALIVLLAITLLVVEPVVRLLRRQHLAVTIRSEEFEKLAMVAKRTSNAVIITDAKRRITWANEGFTRLTGWELHEVLGKSPGAVLQCPQTDPRAIAHMREALNTASSVRTPILNVTKTGEPYWLDLNIEPLRENGVLTGFIAVESDITEQVQAREALQNERAALARTTAQLEEAQALARIGNWELELSSGVLEWSPGTFMLFGRDTQEGQLTFNASLATFEQHDAPRFADAVARASRTGDAFSMVLRTARGNPAVRWVRVDGRARRDVAGDIIGLYGTASDVTEAIEREEALRLAQERAEAASRSKSEFLANMSHEIRTPLTAILGYTDLLRDEAADQGATSDQLQAMDTIRRAGEHLLTVINDILDISKIEAGKLEIEQVNTMLPSVLLDVESLMRARAQAKGVTLQNRLITPVPDRIVTDPTRLRQILMNLVGNAAKFTDQGRILVETSVEQERQGDVLVIAIDDTGPGMTEEQAAQLFQPFTQADSSVTRKHGGTGLGLSICRRLAELMGGHVELVTTAPGRGSRFELRLPLHAAADARPIDRLDTTTSPETAEMPSPRALSGRRILLAEDGEDNQRLITVLLQAAGAEVTVVSNGRQALEALEWAAAGGTPFDLLLSDMQMPEMDGYTLAAKLRAQGNRMPIVALTAHAMADDRRKCLDAGCDDYATKPIDRRALIVTCACWLAPLEITDAPVGASPVNGEIADAAPERLTGELADDPELAELASAFAELLPARVQAIRALAESQDHAGATRLTHQLKGAAGSYGYPSISEIARELEQALTNADADVASLLAKLAAYAESARRGVALAESAPGTVA